MGNRKEGGGNERKERGVRAGEAPSTTPGSCSLAVWAEGTVNGKFSGTWIRRCEVLWPAIRERSKLLVQLRLATCNVSLTYYPGSQHWPRIGRSPHRGIVKNQRTRKFPDNKTTRFTLASEPARLEWAAHSQTPSAPVSQSSRCTRRCDQRRSDGRERRPRGKETDRSKNGRRASASKAPNGVPRIGCGRRKRFCRKGTRTIREYGLKMLESMTEREGHSYLQMCDAEVSIRRATIGTLEKPRP